MGIQFMADFIHGIAPAFAFEQQAGDGDDETEGVADIVISVNDAARNMDARRRLFAGVDEPAFGRARRAGTVIPEINAKIRRSGESKIIILPDVLMRPARHARMRPRGTRHQRLETGGNFVHPEQVVPAPAARRAHALACCEPAPADSALRVSYIADDIYDRDAPLAERRPQARPIDQAQLE